MEISYTKPPIWEKVTKQFNIPPEKVVFYTYGNICYSPSGTEPPADLIRHEETHSDQQGHDRAGAEKWWNQYLHDADFRVEQEAEAYAEQFKFLKRIHTDRNTQTKVLHGLATLLAAPMYGDAISVSDAMSKIKSYADGTAIKNIEDHMGEDGEPEL
jgi:hypothetical protein